MREKGSHVWRCGISSSKDSNFLWGSPSSSCHEMNELRRILRIDGETTTAKRILQSIELLSWLPSSSSHSWLPFLETFFSSFIRKGSLQKGCQLTTRIIIMSKGTKIVPEVSPSEVTLEFMFLRFLAKNKKAVPSCFSWIFTKMMHTYKRVMIIISRKQDIHWTEEVSLDLKWHCKCFSLCLEDSSSFWVRHEGHHIAVDSFQLLGFCVFFFFLLQLISKMTWSTIYREAPENDGDHDRKGEDYRLLRNRRRLWWSLPLPFHVIW